VYRFKTLDDVEAWLKKFCRKAVEQAEHKRTDFAKVQVLKAEEYIREHYNDTDISLSAVCKHLFISTSYISFIFKNYTGETFIEYLTRTRIEKSRKLFKSTNLKTFWKLPLLLGVLGGIAAGALCGVISGTIIAKMKIPLFIATLGMMMVTKGLLLVIRGTKPIYFKGKGRLTAFPFVFYLKLEGECDMC